MKLIYFTFLFSLIFCSCNNNEKNIQINTQNRILCKDSFKDFSKFESKEVEVYLPKNWKNLELKNSIFCSFVDTIDNNCSFGIVSYSQYSEPKQLLKQVIDKLYLSYDTIFNSSITYYKFKTKNNSILFRYDLLIDDRIYETSMFLIKCSDNVSTISYRYLKPKKGNLEKFDDFMRICCSFKYGKVSMVHCDSKPDSIIRLDPQNLFK